MPKKYKNNNKKYGYYYGGSGGGNRHNNNSNYEGSSNDYNRTSRSYSSKNRKIYIKPSLLTDLEDKDRGERSYHNNENSNNNNGSYERGSNSDYRKRNNKDKRRHVVESLKEMGVSKNGYQKLSIGDADNEIKKTLLQSQPHSKLNYLPDDVFNMIVQYVQNYFNCFDSNREGLLGAYNPKCTFSLSLNMSNSVAYRSFKFDESTLRESRNLKRIVGDEDHHREKRFRLQHKGYIDTLSVLCKLPATEHEPKSFKLDIFYFTPTMITFSLSGVFKEGKPTDKVRPMRSFYRVFVCVPDPNSQMTIVNEQFVISNITSEQYKAYYATEQQTSKESQPINNNPNENITNNQLIIKESDPLLNELNDQQKQMIQQFSAQSRLNLQWSKYCLEHVNWNFEDAARAYVQFKDSIPADAFLNV